MIDYQFSNRRLGTWSFQPRVRWSVPLPLSTLSSYIPNGSLVASDGPCRIEDVEIAFECIDTSRLVLTKKDSVLLTPGVRTGAA